VLTRIRTFIFQARKSRFYAACETRSCSTRRWRLLSKSYRWLTQVACFIQSLPMEILYLKCLHTLSSFGVCSPISLSPNCLLVNNYHYIVPFIFLIISPSTVMFPVSPVSSIRYQIPSTRIRLMRRFQWKYSTRLTRVYRSHVKPFGCAIQTRSRDPLQDAAY